MVTPIIEYSELFKRSIGDFTDIVQKEMFVFQDRKGREICLRPEGTASIIRAYIENNLAFLPGVKKIFYFGPMFRAERPQKGRYRQFTQFGTEAIGSDSPLLDAEVIKMNLELFQKMGLNELDVVINSVGCRTCNKDYLIALKKFLHSKKQHLCEDCKIRSEKNPLRVFDCKVPDCRKVYEKAPVIIDFLKDDCHGHFENLKKHLDALDVTYKIDPKLVRGFDYYTKTVFEITSGSLGSQNAILGGGRYDYLVEQMGGKSTPAVGAAAGVERLLLVLEESGQLKDINNELTVYVTLMENIPDPVFLDLVMFLRQKDIKTLSGFSRRSLKAQLNEANNLKADYAVILGEDELKEKSLTIRNMKSSTQEKIKITDWHNPVELMNKLQGG